MAAPQGSFAPVISNVQGIESLTTSGPERHERERTKRDLESERWVGSMDETLNGTRLSRPVSVLSRHSTDRSRDALLEEDHHINTAWALSEEVSETPGALTDLQDEKVHVYSARSWRITSTCSIPVSQMEGLE